MGIQKSWYSSLEILVYLFSLPSGEKVIYSFGYIIARGVASWRNWTISTTSCNTEFLGTALKSLSKGQKGGQEQIWFPITLYGKENRY